MTSTPRSRWIWRALVGGLILGLPAGALLFVRVPVLTVIDVKAERRILALQVRAGDSVVLSSRDSVTQDLVSRTFEVESDGSLLVRETTARPPGPVRPESRLQGAGGERLRELSVSVSPLTEHTLVVKGQALSLSRTLRPGSLVKIRVERQFWWHKRSKVGADEGSGSISFPIWLASRVRLTAYSRETRCPIPAASARS